MRVQLLDPSAFTPPYDRALAAALARAGADVELVTSHFLYGPVPEPEGYRVREEFYRRTTRRGLEAPGRRAFKAAEHLVDIATYRARERRRTVGPAPIGPPGHPAADPPRGAPERPDADPAVGPPPDVVHHQWFTFPAVDGWLMSRGGRGRGVPQVATAHYILPPRPNRRAVLAARSAFGRMDAVIAHSEQGADRLRSEVGLDPARVHVVPHGVFDYLTNLPDEAPLPAELTGEAPAASAVPSAAPADAGPTPAAGTADALSAPADPARPVVLFFGLLRPYKGIDVLLEAFRSVPDAELWIAGNPRMPVEPLREAARGSASPVRIAPRFITDAEIPALMRRADLVVLPYRDIEQSGVLYTALAFGKPLVLTAVGGFPEVAERTGAARLVPPGDPAALAATLNELIADPAARAGLANAARTAATGPYSWDRIAARTLDLYRSLLP